jgi:hypothetical protein
MSAVTLQALRDYFPSKRHFAQRVTALPEYGCIYVRNAKVGTASVLMWLQRVHTGDPDWQPVRSVHEDHTLPDPDDVGMERLAAMLDGEAFRFTFVRDPLRRAESAYLNRIVQMPQYEGRVKLQRVLGLPEDPAGHLTPEQFVAALEASDPLTMNAHWRPQHINLMHPLVTYDHIGRLETFADDLGQIQDALGLPRMPPERRNVTDRRGGPPFDEGLLRRLRWVYEADCDLYGY